jgi:alkyl sulfatase BDS1-like metallo-beta-lactamase superfamily hydrolase
MMVAGMEVEVTPAPSDADDSVTYWFPSLGVAVNNLVWPTLFNVFAIRGEEYRDPRVMLAGLDHLLALGASHLVGTHGPPISGAEEIRERVTRYRDSIQFLWDQTVRLTNKGLTSTELAQAVRLPDGYGEDHLTSERYGVAEHHVRQIRTGLFGFFDGDEANLFPLATSERAGRLIEGFGGRDEVRRQLEVAMAANDLRWALELGSWLVRSEAADAPDRLLLAEALRRVGQRSAAANIRSWCLTRARHLEGTVSTDRLYTHRFRRNQTLAGPIAASVHALRVVLDPVIAEGLDVHLGWRFASGERAGLHVRNGIACPSNGDDAVLWMECSAETWADVLAGSTALSEAIQDGSLLVHGDASVLRATLACFEVGGLRT